MKAISLWQPWATALAASVKQWETRCWPTNVRGAVAIHASKQWKRVQLYCWASLQIYPSFRSLGAWDDPACFPLGCIVAVGELTEVLPSDACEWSEQERALGDFSPGRWAWGFERVYRLATPIPCIGHQGFFEVGEVKL